MLPLPWIVASSAISEFGDWLVFLFAATTLAQNAHSAYLLGAFFSITSLISIAAAPFADAVIKRIGYPRLLFWGRLLQALFVLLMLSAAVFAKGEWLLPVYILAVFPLLKVVDLYTGIGFVALLPEIFPDDQLLRANAAIATAGNLLSVIAPAVSGLLVAALSFHYVLAFDALSYFIAAVVLLPILPRLAKLGTAEKKESDAATATRLGVKIKSLLAIFRALPIARNAALISILFILSGGVVNTIMPAFALMIGDATTYGFITSATGLGFLATSALLMIFFNRVSAKSLVIAGIVIIAGVDAFWAYTHSASAAVVAALINGVGNELYGLGLKTLLQTHIPAPQLVRVYSGLTIVEESTGTVSPMLGGIAAAAFGVRSALVLAAGLAGAALVASLSIRERNNRGFGDPLS